MDCFLYDRDLRLEKFNALAIKLLRVIIIFLDVQTAKDGKEQVILSENIIERAVIKPLFGVL